MSVVPRSRWSLAAPLLVLAGLFGMHGLGDHSATHTDAPHAGMSAAMSTMSHTAATLAGVRDDGQSLVSGPVDETSGAAIGLCVAILLGGLVAWLLVGAATRRTPWTAPRSALAPAPVPRSRAPDPPTPALLSVYRC